MTNEPDVKPEPVCCSDRPCCCEDKATCCATPPDSDGTVKAGDPPTTCVCSV